MQVAHLAACATAEGSLAPREEIRVGDWERYHVPSDGGAREGARRLLVLLTAASDVAGQLRGRAADAALQSRLAPAAERCAAPDTG